MSVTFLGNPVTLQGKPLQIGDKMPEFTLVNGELKTIAGKDLQGLRVFVVVPSIDTGVCDMEVRNFNEKSASLPGVSIYAVSMDLPFAQARWCGAAGVDAVTTLSDYRDRSFGPATGTYIQELGLLARAVFIVDASNTVVYAEYVAEIGEHPHYDAVYDKLKSLL